jgi:hypothetical protein
MGPGWLDGFCPHSHALVLGILNAIFSGLFKVRGQAYLRT